MKVLIIEDQDSVAQYLKKGFEENSFFVDLALDGESGFHKVRNNNYDLIIIDGMLPQLDGWTLVKKIREVKIQKPIVFLSARDELGDRVKGLENGADCYFKKPFAFAELLAQVKSLLRREQHIKSEKIEIKDLVIDLTEQKAFRAGKKLDLTQKEFLLLTYLARHRGEVISRSQILEKVWDIHFDSDTNIVDVHIRRLRSKMDDPYPDKIINTIRGVGYSIDAENLKNEKID